MQRGELERMGNEQTRKAFNTSSKKANFIYWLSKKISESFK